MINVLRAIINKQHKVFWIVTSIISFVMATIIAISTSANIYLQTLQQSKETVYGAFSHIIYRDTLEDTTDANLYGVIRKAQFEQQTPLVFGTLNTNARQLSGLSLPPLHDNEVILTTTSAKHLSLQKGSTWQFQSKQYSVKDVIDNFGLLWIKGVNEETNHMQLPNVIFNENEFNNLQQTTAVIPLPSVWLSQFNTTTLPPTWQNVSGNHYTNTYLAKNVDDYHTPDYLLHVASIIFCIILLITLRTYVVSIRHRYTVYQLLGMTKRHIRLLFWAEIVVLTSVTFILGLLLTAIITSAFLSIALQRIYVPHIHYFAQYLTKYAIMYSLSVLVSLFFFSPYDVSNNTLQIWLKKRLPIDFKMLKLATYSSVFSVLITFLIGNMWLNFNSINDGILRTNAVGKLNTDFDYELVLTYPENKHGSVFYNNAYHNQQSSNGARGFLRYMHPTDDLTQLRHTIHTKFPNAQIETYATIDQVYLMNTNQLFEQPYLQKLHAAKLLTNRPFWNDLYNKPTELLLTNITAYSNEQLRLFSNQLNGNADNVIKGDSVYVVAPAYRYFETIDTQNNATYKSSKPVNKTDKNAVFDTKLNDHAPLHLTYLRANNSAIGMFNSHVAKQIFSPQFVNTTVERIAYHQMGWLDLQDTTTPYRLIVSFEFLNKHGLHTHPTRLRIKLPNMNAQQDDVEMKQLIAQHPTVQVISQHEQLKTFKQYQMMQNGFKVLLVIIFVTLMYLILNGLIQTHIIEQSYKYTVYSLLGMSKWALIRKIVFPFVMSMCLAIVSLTSIEIVLFFGNIDTLSLNDYHSLFLYIVSPMVSCFVTTLFLVHYHVNKFMKQE